MLLWSAGLFGSDEIRMLQPQQLRRAADEMLLVLVEIAIGKRHAPHGCEHGALLIARAAFINQVRIRE